MKKHRQGYLFLTTLLAAALLGGVGWWAFRWFHGGPPPPPRFETVRRGDVEILVTETGTIEPLKQVEVKSKVAGRISRLLVDEGARVAAGQLLAEIDPTEIDSQVAQIRAQLDAARARYQQSVRAVTFQDDQTRSSITEDQEALRSAEAHLASAVKESQAQPGRTDSAVAQARAALDAAKDNLALLEASTQPEALVQARTTEQDARATYDRARRDLERSQALFGRGFVAIEAMDLKRSDLASAKARLEQARKKVEVITEHQRLEVANAKSQVAQAEATLQRALADEAEVPVKEQDVLSARASVGQARAHLEATLAGRQQSRMKQDDVEAARAGVVQLENQLRENQVHQGDTRLLAPVAGTVTHRYIEQGELVTSGVSTFSSGTPVLQIADLSRMLVKLSVNEVDVHQIRIGLPVEVRVDGARGEVFHGRVYRVAPAAATAAPGGGGGSGGSAPAAGTVVRFPVEVVADNPDPRLKPGMSARCTIVIARHRNILRLPADCVDGTGADGQAQVLEHSVKEGRPVDRFTSRKVRVGLRGESHVEILDGLREGERVKPGITQVPKRRAIDLDLK